MKDEIAKSVHPLLVAGLDLKDRVSRNPGLDLVREQAVLKGILSRVADPSGEKAGADGYLGVRYPLAPGRIGSSLYDLPLNSIDLPALRSEARNLIARKGKFRSTRTRRITSPTAPVAPTTATLGNTNRALS